VHEMVFSVEKEAWLSLRVPFGTTGHSSCWLDASVAVKTFRTERQGAC
jgi:hypothetical protein